ncbi:MAG: hypothetical protein ACMXYE_04510 [Candidatus Woesearchaeota archaeon]
MEEDIREAVYDVVNAKWQDIHQHFEQFSQMIDSTENRLQQLEQHLHALEQKFETLHQQVVEKAGNYENHIGQVSKNVIAMSEAFKKAIPEFTMRVAELDRVVQKMKKTTIQSE